MPLSRRSKGIMLETPHIALRSGLKQALAVLDSLDGVVEAESEPEAMYRAVTPAFGLAVYPTEDLVTSVWYDDPCGRETSEGRKAKVREYLARYGSLSDWELRMNNGWMDYWFNLRAGAMMVYGVHMDVIRFNTYDGE